MGGADAVMPRLIRDYDAGNYPLVASIANYLVFADPANMGAREMEADALEQLGYQGESGAARNACLTAAKELRSTGPEEVTDICGYHVRDVPGPAPRLPVCPGQRREGSRGPVPDES